jgi:hypothetical protein
MAYPDDEKFGTQGFTQTNPNGDIINYAPPRPPVGALPSREAEIAALLPALPESLKRFAQPQSALPVTTAVDSAARERDANFTNFGTSLPQDVHENYSQHKNALAEADKYLIVAGHMHNMRNEIESKLDSADFLKELANLKHDDPNFEANTAKLLAKYPLAGGQAVSGAISTLHSARANYLQGTAPGGANEFTAGSPEQTAYINRYHQTKDPRAARAHAQNVQKGEEMVKTAVANGLLDLDKDFPAWDGNPDTRPKVYNDDGSVNYHEVGLLAANRAGELGGKAVTAEARSAKAAVDLLAKFDSDPVLGRTPEAKELKPILLKRILDYEKGRSDTTASGAANTGGNAVKKYTAGF